MKYHNRNVSNLNKLADNTKAAAFKWYQYCIDNGIEVLIYETIRTVEQQREYVRKGASQTMRSYHLVGQALDFVPIQSNGTEDWNGYNKEPWASAIRYAKQIGFEWGGDWKGFVDSPHLQYNYKGYGTDTFGKGAQNVVTPPTSNDSVGVAYINGSNVNLRKGPGTGYGVIRQLGKGESYKVFGQTNGWLNLGGDQWVYNDPSYIRYTGGNVPATSQSSNDGVGVVTIIADVLRVRTGPGTNYGIVKNVYQGEKYQSFGYKDGWYNVGGNQWVSGEYVTFVK
ncbi:MULTISPECIES: SH3 domain-containing protein [Bacillus]|uniref:L-alanyl-D-glutamate peptidase Ply n=5 Tax=Bacillus cereus group TaxID=86661 RepID=A0A9W3SBK0_BACTU|nr:MULTISPECIES: SH3 domain-containing protein [Bacillus]MDV8109972.1 M15 family metallopeptidase [Bacillus sp. BAU-SS-2023]AEA16333.1 L-alanyl-D-glutamate peptidase [Bacillus thuringiensis serovar chinensis CT-43]AFV18467.1 L-alanyl-D-glutamate peptidase Ply [Bacillus thuringiensis Bt407]AGG01418.1 Phage N-acetylmuramoyl-L-alanine amidase [Bacillus thuringiensis serovar thuringiensis str. IS5056]ANC08140.1 peptidase M15 [Bacillus cereus]